MADLACFVYAALRQDTQSLVTPENKFSTGVIRILQLGHLTLEL
jgi:hypothetical protein